MCLWGERPQISLADFYRLAKGKISAENLTLTHPPPPEMLRAQPRADQTSFSSLLKHHMLFHCWCCHVNFSLASGSYAWGPPAGPDPSIWWKLSKLTLASEVGGSWQGHGVGKRNLGVQSFCPTQLLLFLQLCCAAMAQLQVVWLLLQWGECPKGTVSSLSSTAVLRPGFGGSLVRLEPVVYPLQGPFGVWGDRRLCLPG